MFPSTNSDNPFELSIKSPSLFHCDHPQSPSFYKQDDHSHFFLNFPSPFFDEHQLPLHQILTPNQHMAVNQSSPDHQFDKNISTDLGSTKEEKCSSVRAPKSAEKASVKGRRSNVGAIPRKRTGKKDRHSKICTAQGIRDRRMRLSLQVARKFFDLQDMLGYDKASKTIEWLFSNSNNAIKELTNKQGKSESLMISECEEEGVYSSGFEVNSGIGDMFIIKEHCNKTTLVPSYLRPDRIESREKARARARSRTREKTMLMNKSNPYNPFEIMNNNVHDQESSSNNNNNEQEGRVCSHSSYPSFGNKYDADVGTIEKLLLQGSGSSSAAVTACRTDTSTDSNSNNFVGSILGNWDTMMMMNNNINRPNHELQLAGSPNSIFSPAPDYFPLFHH